MFYIDLEPNKNNMEIFNIRYLYNAVTTIEDALKFECNIQAAVKEILYVVGKGTR